MNTFFSVQILKVHYLTDYCFFYFSRIVDYVLNWSNTSLTYSIPSSFKNICPNQNNVQVSRGDKSITNQSVDNN